MATDIKVIEPEFHKVCDELPGAEGPVFTRNGQFYCVAAMKQVDGKPAGEIVKVDLDAKTKTTFCCPNFVDHGGMPAGLQSDKENNLWVADMAHGILKVTPDGQATQISRVDGKGDTMQGCNDCIFDYDGNLWVSAPASNIAPEPFKMSQQEPFGAVYCVTKNGNIAKIDTGYYFSNGLAVQHDKTGKPQKLIVAESVTKSLWSYDILGPGEVTNKQLWGKVPDDGGLHGPDGMDFDEAGNLLVANWNASHIEVFGPNGGEPHTRIKTPFVQPTNVHFKQNSNICYVTEHTNHALWWFNWTNNGRKEYCEM